MLHSSTMKRTTKHTIYEVWCEYKAESVYIDHHPTLEEIEKLRKRNWPGTDEWSTPFKLQVFKLHPLYTK